MRTFIPLAFVALVPAVAIAQNPVATVKMSNFKFAPTNVRLRAGVPVTLHLANAAGGGHNFSAPAFFAAAKLDPAAAALVHDGKVEVPAHSAVDLKVVPAQGEYPLKCTHTLHSSFGMKGVISVRP